MIHSFLYRANILSRIAGALAGVSFIISSERCLTRNKHPLAVWLDRWTSPLSRYVMANSEAVAQQLRKRERVKPDKIRVIYSGIDKTAGNLVLSREKRAEIKSFLNLSPSDYIIGCVARLHSDKGLDDLLKACALADKSFSGFSLLLVGDGPEKEHLESLAKDLGLTEKIRFTGFYHEVETIIQLFDLFVLPSLEESFPLSVLEAMSFGLPVIATAVGGVPEMVAANETGILVPPHHPEILANKILELIRNPDLAKKMGQAGKVRVENHFSFSNCLSQIEGLYKDALKNFDYQCNMER